MGRCLGLGLIVLLLVGCGGAQTSVVPQRAIVPQGQSASTSSGELLYVLMTTQTYVLTYPGLTQVKKVNYGHTRIIASDPNNGNVIIGNNEFAHGKTTPFATLKLKAGQHASAAAFDPITGDIAYSIVQSSPSRKSWIAIYRDLSAIPKVYSGPNVEEYLAVGYDGDGTLYAFGQESSNNYLLLELPKGKNKFVTIHATFDGPWNLLWDGTYLVIRRGRVFCRVTVSPSKTMKIVGKTLLRGSYSPWEDEFAIQGDSAVGPHTGNPPHDKRVIALWDYPTGGPAYQLQSLNAGQERIYGVAISVAPSAAWRKSRISK
jgi:hypothetical protein